MSRLLLVGWLLAFGHAMAKEPVDNNYFWEKVVPDANYRMYMASENAIVCYAGRVAPKEFFVLTRSGDSFQIRRTAIPGLPEKPREIAPGIESRPSISDIAVVSEDSEIRLAWLQQVNNAYKIHTLRIAPHGEATHDVIRDFAPNEPVFNLGMHILAKNDVLFFYVYHSEKHLSPISDTGDIAKIWALRWRGGKTEFDRQLSARGQVQNSSYVVRKVGDNRFDLAWSEDRHGAFGFRHRLGTGRLTLAENGPRLDEIAHFSPVKDDESRPVEFITLKALAADDEGNSQPAISITFRGKPPAGGSSVQEHRLFSLDGAAVRDFRLPSRSDALSFDDKSRLWRYLDRPLYRGSKPTPGEQNVHWTNFGDRNRAQKIVLPLQMAAHLVQAPGDCFYWLEAEGQETKLKKACRPL